MKSWLACLGSVVLGVNASGQDTPPEAHVPFGDYTDGSNEFAWKIQNPSGPGDWWCSWKGTRPGRKVDALVVDLLETAGRPGLVGELGVYPALSSGVPDIANPLAARTDLPVPAGSPSDRDEWYSVPAVTLGTSGAFVAARYATGDSHVWMSSDTSTNLGRTCFTSNGYATGGMPMSAEIDLHLGSPYSGAPGDLLINGSTHASFFITDYGPWETFWLDFFGPAPDTRFILYLCNNGAPFFQLLPLALTVTDGPLGGSCPGSWQICTQTACWSIPPVNLELCTIYADGTDLKANGKPRLKQGRSAFLDLDTSGCYSSGSGVCFGQKDDCFVDLFIWKATNPAGPSDWFSVNHDVPRGGIASLTELAISSVDFCGIGPCWAEVGIYPSNLALDPAGTTPDINQPLTALAGNSACMAPSALDLQCPLTVYDVPDYTVDSRASGGVHAAVRWASGDSCIWLGSDTDGTDSSCGILVPNDGTHSLFSTNSYTTPALRFTGANWMIQIDWN